MQILFALLYDLSIAIADHNAKNIVKRTPIDVINPKRIIGSMSLKEKSKTNSCCD